jgi:hypothetical protein
MHLGTPPPEIKPIIFPNSAQLLVLFCPSDIFQNNNDDACRRQVLLDPGGTILGGSDGIRTQSKTKKTIEGLFYPSKTKKQLGAVLS